LEEGVSAADEYRLLALTMPWREIVSQLDLPEDMRVMLVWLEEHGYGNVDAHVDDAMAAAYWHNSQWHNSQWQYVGAKTRCSWLMHYVSSAGIEGLRWPPKDADSPVWMHAAALDRFRQDNALYDLGESTRSKNVQQAVSCWQRLLFAAGVTLRAYNPAAPLEGEPMWTALSHLDYFQKQGYAIFVPGVFFRGYAHSGRGDYVTAGTQSQGYSPAASLRWR
jgi:hypothetical protein